MTAQRLLPFGESIFTTMTMLANQHGAINLSQGFPDFDGPEWLKEAAVEAIRSGPNQYAPSHGNPALREALARKAERDYALRYDPASEITVLCGATEAIAAVLLGVLNAGDEVILLEPFYDSYPACIAMAGAVARPLPLRAPDFEIDYDHLQSLISPRTRLLILNSPGNPSGKVLSLQELTALAEFVQRHDLLLMTDEVYEHIVFPPHKHIPAATLDGMRERTLLISSFSKTLSMTGWKVGYVYAPAKLTAAVRAAHQFLTFCAVAPFQAALAKVIDEHLTPYLRTLAQEYQQRRDLWLAQLERAGLQAAAPGGTYFAVSRVDGDDVEFCKRITTELKVAAIPCSAFYQTKEAGKGLVRWAFCKNLETLRQAGERLARIRV